MAKTTVSLPSMRNKLILIKGEGEGDENGDCKAMLIML
jgi:hypothetical protein